MNNFEGFLKAIESAAQYFLHSMKEEVLVLHHNDTDGLTSGAILKAAFQRLHLATRSFCLEKPYPSVVTAILADPLLQPGTMVVFADFGSGMLPEISRINAGRFPIFVLDHHLVEEVSDPSMTLVNCLDYGVRGNSECSASAVCFQFALGLHKDNSDLAKLAVLGALGDRQRGADGLLLGINKINAELGGQTGGIRYHEDYEICWENLSVPGIKIVEFVDALGSIGYFSGGPDIALKGLSEGFGDVFQQYASAYRTEYLDAVKRFAESTELQTNDSLQWFSLDGSFKTMGVKTVGLVCEYFIDHGLVDPSKYLAGFQEVPNQIPGIGPFELNQTKISMRLPKKLYEQVQLGIRKPLTKILPPATRLLNGFVDACHIHAAATTIPVGRENDLIAELTRLATEADL